MASILVIGGTGAMGARVVRRLLRHADAEVGVLTRDPDGERAQALRELGDGRVRLLAGEPADPESLRVALVGVEWVFCNTNFFAGGTVTGEFEDGLAVLDAARTAGVQRFIWSSLDSALALTDGAIAVPHYDAKAAVTADINRRRSEEMMRRDADGWFTHHVSSLTTAPYFENLPERFTPQPGPLPDGRHGVTFALPIGDGRFPMIALDDIAWFTDLMFERWQAFGGRDLAVVGDSPTGAEIAETFEAVTGTPAGYVPVPLDVVESWSPDFGHDFAAMCRLFQTRDLAARDRDLPRLRELHPGLMSFEGWLRETGWTGT